MLSVRVLGTVSVVEGEHSLPLTRPLERRLLAVLVINRGHAVLDDQIVDALWPTEPPANPIAALQSSISRLRGAIGAESVLREGGGYRLSDDVEVDADRFEALLLDDAASRETLNEALNLWTGDAPYLEFRYDDFAIPEVERLQDLRLVALERYFQARLDAGESDRLVPDLEVLIKENPLRERLYEVLITALYRAGRQADALRTYRLAREQLAEVGLVPSAQLAQLEEDVLLQSPSLDEGAVAYQNNLPSRIASIVGRDDEIDVVVDAMDSYRLVTLTGPAGVGKTTVAFEAARRISQSEQDVWWLDLAAVRHPDDLATHLAERLATSMQREIPTADGLAALTQLVGTHSMALIFDNCEHLVDEAASVVRRLLEQCSRASVLATSRERLALVGERVIQLSPLGLPPVEVDPLNGPQAGPTEAIQLFVDRARDAAPMVEITEDDMDDVVRLCRLLDGLPLAIELAAARMTSLALPDIIDQLSHHHNVLAGQRATDERHSSLQAAIAWSYDLLDPSQQEQLQRLATISGPFRREEVALLFGEADAVSVAQRLAEFQERSLVHSDAGRPGSKEYRLYFMVREFARARASDDGRSEEHARIHAECFLALSQEAESHLRYGGEQIEWYGRIRDSVPDFIRAIDRFVEIGDHDSALRIAGGIGQFWGPTRLHRRGYQLVTRLLEAAGDRVTPSTARAHRIAAQLGVVDPSAPAFHETPTHVEKAQAAALEVDDRRAAVEAPLFLAIHQWFTGDRTGGLERMRRCRAEAVEAGYAWAEGYAMLFENVMLHTLDRSGVAEAGLREAADKASEWGDSVMGAYSHLYLGCVLRDAGRYRESAEEYRTAYLIGGRFGLPLLQPVAATGVLLGRWLDGDVDGALIAEERTLKLAAVRPVDEIVVGFSILLNDPDIPISPDELRAAVATVFAERGEDRARAASRVVLSVFERAATRLGPDAGAATQRALDLLDSAQRG